MPERLKSVVETVKGVEISPGLMLSVIPEAVVISGLDRKIISGNQLFLDLFGYELKEIENKDTQSLYAVLEEWQEVGSSHYTPFGTPERFTVRYRRKDGTIFFGETSASLLHDVHGIAQCFVGVIRDVTAQKEASEEQFLKTARFDATLNRAGIGIWERDNVTNDYYFSDSWFTMLGYDPKEFAGDCDVWFKLCHPDDQDTVLRLISEITPGIKQTFRAETRIRNREGNWTWVLSIGEVLEFAGSQAKRIGGVHINIHEMKLAMESERRYQRILQLAVDTAPQRFFWKDRNGVFLGCNEKLANDAGFASSSDLIGKTDYDMVWAEYADLYRADDEAIMAAGIPRINFEEELILGDGDVRYLRTTKSPLRDDNGEVIGIVGTFEDITEEKRMTEELIRAKEVAEAANRAKGDFLANMSHEIRTPLNAILGMTELLQETSLTERQLEDIRDIKASGQLLLRIINDILDLSKMDAGRLEIIPTPTKLQTSISRIVAILKQRVSEGGLKLNVINSVPDGVALLIDEIRLEQILLNLIGNSCKFTPRGGSITLKVNLLSGDSPVLVCSVRDTGIGIPEDKLESVFSAFVQADSSMTRKYGGTGLGLSICKRLVELMGGRISVASSLGAGSEFETRIPTSIVSKQDAEPAGENLSGDTALHLNVLLAEDNAVNQKLVVRLLEKLSCTVTIAENGKEAIDIFRNQRDKVDLILMDCQMPELSGYETTQIIRKMQDGGDVPIIALTADVLDGVSEKCRAAGMNDYLAKPLKFEELFRALKAYRST